MLEEDILEIIRATNPKASPPPAPPPANLPIICTKFPELVPWLKAYYGIVAVLKPKVTKIDCLGGIIYGQLPEYLASLCAKYYKIEVPYATLNSNPTPEQLNDAGAHLVLYRVEAIEIIEPTQMPKPKLKTNTVMAAAVPFGNINGNGKK